LSIHSAGVQDLGNWIANKQIPPFDKLRVFDDFAQPAAAGLGYARDDKQRLC